MFRSARFLPLLLVALTSAACGASKPPVVSAGTAAAPEDQTLMTSLTSTNPEEVARAADELSAKVSPWQRAIQRARREKSIRLFQVERPTGRAAHRQDARAIERAAIAAHERLTTPASALARERVLVLLGEVGGDAATAYLRTTLERTKNRDDAVPMMRALETIYGLPAFYEPHAMQCGEPGPEEMTRRLQAEHAATEEQHFVTGRRELFAWLDRNAKRPRADQVHAAFAAWDARAWLAQPDRAPEEIDFDTVLRYAPVVRLGEDALPELEARKTAAPTNREAGRYETLIAAISGKLDDPLVRRLLDDDSDYQAVVAGIEAIAAAGSRRWTRELDALQRSTTEEVANAASKALAGILGHEALPLLRAAATSNPRNYTAKYAAEELERAP